MPTLRQLRYLVAVSETLNFRRAAGVCHVSQPTLSDQIKALEARLKVQLFERSRRQVVLTPMGREVCDRARRVLRDVQDMVDLAEKGRHILHGRIRLGVLPSLGPYLLPLVLPYLRERYPELTLYLREDTADNLLRRLEQGELDLLIYPSPVRDPRLAVAALFEEPLWLAVPAAHPIARKQQVDHADLRGETVLALEPGHSLHAQVLTLCREHDAVPLLDFATTSLDTLRQMAGMGIGATFLPALYVRAEARDDPQIAVRPFAPPQPSRHMALVWRRNVSRGPQYEAVAAHVRSILTATVPEITVQDQD